MAWVQEVAGRRGTRHRGCYRDPEDTVRSAGSDTTRREAFKAANREEQKVLAGSWHDAALGNITFREYVEREWLPHKHLEASTRAAYVSYLNKHVYPFVGQVGLNKITRSWVPLMTWLLTARQWPRWSVSVRCADI